MSDESVDISVTPSSKLSSSLLKQVPIFEGIRGLALRRLASVLEIVSVRHGASVFEEGKPAAGMYIIANGEVKIGVKGDAEPIAELSGGKIFAELALLDEAPMMVRADACVNTTLILLRRDTLVRLINEKPALGGKIVLNLSR